MRVLLPKLNIIREGREESKSKLCNHPPQLPIIDNEDYEEEYDELVQELEEIVLRISQDAWDIMHSDYNAHDEEESKTTHKQFMDRFQSPLFSQWMGMNGIIKELEDLMDALRESSAFSNLLATRESLKELIAMNHKKLQKKLDKSDFIRNKWMKLNEIIGEMIECKVDDIIYDDAVHECEITKRKYETSISISKAVMRKGDKLRAEEEEVKSRLEQLNSMIADICERIDEIEDFFREEWKEEEYRYFEWNVREIISWFMYKSHDMDDNVNWIRVGNQMIKNGIHGSNLDFVDLRILQRVGLGRLATYLINEISMLEFNMEDMEEDNEEKESTFPPNHHLNHPNNNTSDYDLPQLDAEDELELYLEQIIRTTKIITAYV